MLRLHELGWVANVYRKNLDARVNTVRRYLRRGGVHRLNGLPGAVHSTGLMIGFESVFSGMTVMRM